VTREDITFTSGGQTCAAWLYLPEAAGAPSPCVVMAHGFGGTRSDAVPDFAERFVDAGLAALVFD
jgi:dienelactone hydrolase